MGASNFNVGDLEGQIATINAHIANLHFKLIENVSFTFNNAVASNTRTISEVDNILASAKMIVAFVPANGITAIPYRNSAKTAIGIWSDTARNGTFGINLFVVW